MQEYILVHDAGTTGDKAIVFNRAGSILASVYTRYETYYPRPTWAEQSPEEWWAAVCSSSKQAIEQAQISAKDIAAVSMVGQQLGAVPTDRKGRAVRGRTIIWCDARSTEQATQLMERLGGFDEFYKITGLGHVPEIDSICKVMWLKRNEPTVYGDAYKFLQCKDFLVARLTDGETLVDDYTDASNTGWLDIRRRDYSRELLDSAGIAFDKLPELHESHEIVGHVAQNAARETGLRAGIPVILGSGDVPSSSAGAGIFRPGMCFGYIGSANWGGVYSTEPLLDPKTRTVTVCHPCGGYVIFSYTPAGGIVQDWGVELLCELERDEAARTGVSVYDSFAAKVKRTAPGATGLVFLPYLRGGGGPHWNSNARGLLVGLAMPHKKDHILRALLEGVAFNFRWIMEASGLSTSSLGEVRAIGGGARNLEWMHIYADILGMKVMIVEMPQEATGRGGFLAGAVGMGWYRDYPEAIEKTVKVETVIEPNSKNHGIYEHLYSAFRLAYEGSQKAFDELAAFQSTYGAPE
jgi:xylulokinase